MERKRIRFARERQKDGFKVPLGTFEAVQLAVKQVYPEETMGVSDTSFWSKIEERAKEMTLDQACFQYFIAGTGHKTLAKRVVNSFPNVVASAELDTNARDARDRAVEEMEEYLYDHYPEKYRNKIPR